LVGVAILFYVFVQPHEPPEADGRIAIVVLPFLDLSPEKDQDYFSDGMTEEITTALAKVPGLRVLARTSAFEFKGKNVNIKTVGEQLGASHLIEGSVRKAGDRLRITARVVDAATRQAVAHARADGSMAEIFDLQDAIVTQLSAGLQLTVTPARAARMRARETSSLDAYRALTEGRLKLETLDAAAVPGAIADFQRALVLDPRYAMAHVGLGHACFWRFQASRAAATPETDQLAQAVAHAKRAVDLDPDLAEAHFRLGLGYEAADRSTEAVAAGRLAVAIEPANWRHQFRYGIAAWGSERLEALGRVQEMFPPLGFTYFAAAMVHIARGDFAAAARVLSTGISFEQTADGGSARLPVNGLHWLSGLLKLAAGDEPGARAAFDREMALAARGLFGQEYAMDACVGHAYASLRQNNLDAASQMFEAGLARYPSHARSWLGLASVRYQQGRRGDTEAALYRGLDAIDALRAQGRAGEAALAAATAELLAGRTRSAIDALATLVNESTAATAGWTIPIEPAFASIAKEPAFLTVLDRLAAARELTRLE